MYPLLQTLELRDYVGVFPKTIRGNLIVTGVGFAFIGVNFLICKFSNSSPKHDDDKGTAKWANDNIDAIKKNDKKLKREENLVKVIIDDPTPKIRGIILHQDKEYYYVDAELTHANILGITGAGKDQTLVFPNIDLLSKPAPAGDEYKFIQESMIITDPKAEQCSTWAEELTRRGYNVKILNLEEPYYSDSYDPFLLIKEAYQKAKTESKSGSYDLSEVVNLISAFATILTSDPDAKEKFWQNTARDLITGINMAMTEDLIPNFTDLSTPFTLSTLLSEFATTFFTAPDGKTQIRKLDWYFNEREIGNRAKSIAASAISSSDKTKESIISTALSALSIFADEGVARLTSTNTINFRDIIEKPTAVFLVCPDDDPTRWALASIFIEQASYALSKMIKRDYRGKSPRRINYIFNEFAQFPEIPHMDKKMSMWRSRNIRALIYLQDYNQLEVLYGKKASTIKNNCANTIYLRSTDFKTVKEIKDKLNNKTILTESISQRSNENHSSVTENTGGRPLMFENDLMELPFERGVVLRSGYKPILANFKAAFRYLNLEQKGMRELTKRANHADLDLRIYNDYLTGTNALDVYRSNNHGSINGEMFGFNLPNEFDYGNDFDSISDKNIKNFNGNDRDYKEDLKREIYQDLLERGVKTPDLATIMIDEELEELIADHIFTGSKSTVTLRKSILRLLKDKYLISINDDLDA